jgi:hypothetical protein
MGIQVLHAILCGVSILLMFDQRFYFEILPNFHLGQIWGVPAIGYTIVSNKTSENFFYQVKNLAITAIHFGKYLGTI